MTTHTDTKTYEGTEIIVHDDKTWTCGDDEGYVSRFAGNWVATHTDDAGEPNVDAYSTRSPEAAIHECLEMRSERADLWPEPYDWAGDR